jgi:hypothetical protein
LNAPDISERLHGKFKLIVVEELSIRSQISTGRELHPSPVEVSPRSPPAFDEIIARQLTDLTWGIPKRRVEATFMSGRLSALPSVDG